MLYIALAPLVRTVPPSRYEHLEKLDLEPLDQTAVAGTTVVLPCR